MKLKYIFTALLALVGLTACDSSPTTVKSVQTNPQFVCALSDGRQLYRFEVDNSQGHNHWVYLFANSNDPITINHDVQQGKVTVNQAVVEIPQVEPSK